MAKTFDRGAIFCINLILVNEYLVSSSPSWAVFCPPLVPPLNTENSYGVVVEKILFDLLALYVWCSTVDKPKESQKSTIAGLANNKLKSE